MDQTRLKRPSSNLKWLWWGLGSFFALQAANRFSPGGPASLAIASRFSTASRQIISNLTKRH